MKKGLMNVITLALVLVNLILTVMMVFTFVPAINKTSKLVDKIGAIVDLNAGGEQESGDGQVSVTDIATVDVKFSTDAYTTVSLKSDADGKMHYCKFAVTISLNSKAKDYDTVSASIDKAMSIVASTCIDAVSNYTASNIDKTTVQNDILTKLQGLFETDTICGINLGQYAVQ